MAFRTYELPVATSPGRQFVAQAYVAAAAIKQGQVVKADGSNSDEVTPSDTDGEVVIGVAAYDAAAGDVVLVLEEGGRARLTSGSGTISAGDPLTSYGGTGENGEVDTASAGDYVLGRAVRDDAGTNDDVLAQLSHIGVHEEAA